MLLYDARLMEDVDAVKLEEPAQFVANRSEEREQEFQKHCFILLTFSWPYPPQRQILLIGFFGPNTRPKMASFAVPLRWVLCDSKPTWCLVSRVNHQPCSSSARICLIPRTEGEPTPNSPHLGRHVIRPCRFLKGFWFQANFLSKTKIHHRRSITPSIYTTAGIVPGDASSKHPYPLQNSDGQFLLGEGEVELCRHLQD